MRPLTRPHLFRARRTPRAPRAPRIAPPPRAYSTEAHHGESVNKDEVNHFTSMANEWWDPHGPSQYLLSMNPWRHKFIASCRSAQADAPNTLPDSLTYLDVGCGGGIFAESAARLATTKSVTAIDPTTQLINVARAHARRDPMLLRSGKLTYLNTSIEQLRQSGSPPPQGYDIVSLFEVIEHVNNPTDFLAQVTPLVKPGGWFVLSTIARTWRSWLTTKFMAEEVLRFVPRGTHDWNKYINEAEVREWFLHGAQAGKWESPRSMGVLPVPGIGWQDVTTRSEPWGDYFFGIRRARE